MNTRHVHLGRYERDGSFARRASWHHGWDEESNNRVSVLGRKGAERVEHGRIKMIHIPNSLVSCRFGQDGGYG